MAFLQEQYRPQLHAAMAELSAFIFDTPEFSSASFRFSEPVGPGDNTRLQIRPVVLEGEMRWQLTRADRSENKGHGAGKKFLWELINSSNILQEAHVTGTDGAALHLRVTRKGHVLLERIRAKKVPLSVTPAAEEKDAAEACLAGVYTPEAVSEHDRRKDYPLTRFDSARLLLALGFTTSDGVLKPSMHAKYRQVNEFLRMIDAVLDELPPAKNRDAKKPLFLVDCGCGKSYLSFSAKAYMEAVRKQPVQLTGIDLKQNVIAFCRRTAEVLGMEDTCNFVVSDIAKYKPSVQPDMVLSLHACDTATDEALAFGAENACRAILCAPCCQHELQKSLAPSMRPHRAILRNGILRERLADLLTDSFRAQILRVMGYRATVVEFVDTEATARNILIRAARVSRPGTGTALSDYDDLREAWGVTPYLAQRLSKQVPALTAPLH